MAFIGPAPCCSSGRLLVHQASLQVRAVWCRGRIIVMAADALREADVSLTWSLVIPVKVLAHAKSRLAGLAGPHRPALALALAADTVASAVACAATGQVIVVTDDATAAGELAGLGAVIVPDEPSSGLNPALAHGAAVAASRRPQSGIAALSADLPALRPRFGVKSRAAHRGGGAAELLLTDVPGLRRDVDTPADLRSAARLGLGPRTAPFAA